MPKGRRAAVREARAVAEDQAAAGRMSAMEAATLLVEQVKGEPGSLDRLVFVRELRERLADIEVADVALLRDNGVPWSRIGQALGVTGQAVSMRYGSKLGRS